jgi:hypothetical protein
LHQARIQPVRLKLPGAEGAREKSALVLESLQVDEKSAAQLDLGKNHYAVPVS